MEDIPDLPLIKKQSSNLHCHLPSHNSMLEFICLDPKCSNKRLICSDCHKFSHAAHEVMHYNVFIQLCNDKTVQLKNLQSSVEEELKKSEIKHVESLNSIKDSFIAFIDQLIEKQTYPFFQNLKQTSNSLINPDIINTAISTLSDKMESCFDIKEVNNQLEIITQNLTYSDEQLGLKLQFGPGIFTSKIVNEITSMTDAVNSYYQKIKETFQDKMDRVYNLTSKSIEELSKKMDEVTEKTDFNKLNLTSENTYQIENEEINTIEIIRTSENKEEQVCVAIGLKSGRIKIFNLDRKEAVKKFYAHEAECTKLLFIKETMSLYSSGLDKKLAVWKVSEGFSLQTNLENVSSFVDFCSIPEDKLLAMISGKILGLAQYNLIKLTNIEMEEDLCRVAYMNSMQVASRLICGDVKGNLYYLDVIDHGEKVKSAYRILNVHNGPIENVHIIENKDLFITTGVGDNRIIFHNAVNFQKIKEVKTNFGIRESFFDPLDETIFLNSGTEELSLFNLQSESVENKLRSSKFMNNYVWVHCRKILVCGLRDEKKTFIYLRCFE